MPPPTPPPHTRRTFLKTTLVAGAALGLEWGCGTPQAAAPSQGRRLKLALIADLHNDVMPDGPERLAAFLAAARAGQVDAVVQLGDFATPHPRNAALLAGWRGLDLPRHSVLGNHDTDGGFQRTAAAAAFGMPACHYSVVTNGVRLVFLDGNIPNPKVKGYACSLGQEQLDWLDALLATDRLPVLVFVHQPPENCLHDGKQLLDLLAKANQAAGTARILACVSGHLHQDSFRAPQGIPCVEINSASYYWVGGHTHRSMSEEIHKKCPSLASTCPYEGPLWAVLTVDAAAGTLEIEGMQTRWVGPSPQDLKVKMTAQESALITPKISARHWKAGQTA